LAQSSSAGEPASAISNAVIQRVRDTTGRGPNRARTTVGRDSIFVVIEDSLTKGERTLVEAGNTGAVTQMRSHYQAAMAVPVRADIERLTGRRVVAFMSANHVEPDLAVEAFILAPDDGAGGVAEGDAGA
jgi:uncharacterized protein YbcI